MSINDDSFFEDSGVIHPFQRISYAKKKANDFRWAEKVADFYDNYYGYTTDSNRIKKLKMNYDLYNGRGESAMKEYYNDFGYELQEEGLEGGYNDMQHHPIIDQVAKAMVGEQQRRPLKPIAIDSSGYTTNVRKLKRNELLQNYIRETVLNPIQSQAIQQVMLQLGIQDPYSLSPEEQQQFQGMVQQKAKAMTPDEIQNYMRKDYKSPTETQAQKIIDYVMKEYDIKYLTDQGFKHGIISGEEIYYVSVRHKKLHVELVNPMGFASSAASNTHYIEDGEWAKYERQIKYTDLFNNFGDILKPKDLKKMENLFNSTSGSSRDSDGRLVAEITRNDSNSQGRLFNSAPDIRTRDGQEFMKFIYNTYGSEIDNYSSVRHTHIVWKSLRKLFYIERRTESGVKGFWVDENYVFNKMKGDVSSKEVWVPELWECDKIGTIDGIYLNKRPIPYQYSSIDDPWDIKLPYVGVQYGKLFNNTENASPMDLGKPWQYKFNVQMSKIHEMEATDVGKILLTTMGAKPKDWSWGKWIMMMKYGKIAPIDTQSEGFNAGIDSQIFKQIDLSTLSDLAGRLQYLEFIRNQVALSMSYNPSRLGQVAPYVAVTNSQQSIVQSSYQTEDIYSTHNKVVENLLNSLVRSCRMAFKENDFARTYLLDDMSIAELEVDWELMDISKIGVTIRNSTEDYNNIMGVKNVAQAMVQNGLITMPELIKVMWATNGSEILNIAENAEMNAQKRRQEDMQNQQALMQQQADIQKEIADLQRQFDMEKQSRDHQKDLMVAEINATRFSRQYDINENQLNDQYEQKLIQLQHDKQENEKDRLLEKEKMEMEKKLKEREFQIKSRVVSKK